MIACREEGMEDGSEIKADLMKRSSGHRLDGRGRWAR